MEEAKSSWNTTYLSKEGFECQITLRDDDEKSLSERIDNVTVGIIRNSGTPLKRSGFKSDNGNSNNHEEPTQEKTYIDSKGVRRCNLKLNNGKHCNTVVVDKEGKYGRFWSCSNYKEHAQ